MDGFLCVDTYILPTYKVTIWWSTKTLFVCKKFRRKKMKLIKFMDFFFNFLKLFLIVFNFSTEKSVILSWYRLQPNSSKLNSWNAEIFWVFLQKKAPIFFVVLCKKIKPQRNMTSIEVTYQASVDCRLWF